MLLLERLLVVVHSAAAAGIWLVGCCVSFSFPRLVSFLRTCKKEQSVSGADRTEGSATINIILLLLQKKYCLVLVNLE